MGDDTPPDADGDAPTRSGQATDEADADAPSVAALRGRRAGEDDDPYEDVDVETLPDWWRAAIEEFEAHDLRPYRPPRFSDGTIAPPVVQQLEQEHDCTITLVGEDVRHGDAWSVYVDDTQVGTIDRHRSAAGYTVYELSRDTFTELITAAVTAD